MITFMRNGYNWLKKNLNIFANLVAENISLRHQLAVLKRNTKRPALKGRDRLFWVLLSRVWPDWRTAILIVQPDTVVRWHKRAFKFFWWHKSQRGKRVAGNHSTLKFVASYSRWRKPIHFGVHLRFMVNF